MFLYYLIIAPIEMIVEWVFYFFMKINVGGVISAVMGVSIVINFLALPLYNIADALQDKERQISRRLEPRLKRIRKAFKGDEQFMMISTYYRQNDYHPLYVLRSSLSILIEIPFFIAAYHFLSHCPMLLGEHFWIFKDLGSPDRMWTITLGTLSLPINILPIIMTAINVVSAAVYTRGGTIKEKVQIYALAAIFLVLLYESPSGLVIYWILNNLFSLFKNIIQKMKHPHRILSYIIAIGLLALSILLILFVPKTTAAERLSVGLLGIAFLILPTTIDKIQKLPVYTAFLAKAADMTHQSKSDLYIFLFSGIGLAIFLGFLLPASVIATSPTEFSFLGKTDSPFSYIHSSFWTFLGLCIFWPLCIWFMFSSKVKHILTVLFPALLICALCNVYLFKADYGNLNAVFLVSETMKKMKVPHIYYLLSLLVMIGCIAVYYLCRMFHKKAYLSVIIFSICLGMTALGIYKSDFIRKEYKHYCEAKKNSNKISQSADLSPVYHLSKNNKNVVIIFLDRAMGGFVPYIMEEFPSLKETFSGWTYYPNTLSFGRYTNTGIPSMIAGYEYTPDNINDRNSELLVDKHNEACLVMPKLFTDAGFDATVTDMPWLNYSWEGDLSVYAPYSNIHGYNILGNHLSNYYLEKKEELSNTAGQSDFDKICRDKIRYFSLVQSIHPALRNRIYVVSICDIQRMSGVTFEQSFSHLYLMPKLTDFTNDKPTYTFITNNCTHDYTNLNVPNYDTICQTDTVEYGDYTPAFHSDDIEINQAYQVNTSALLQIGKWLNYLKDNNAYNNTRIIIVSDHGRDLNIKELYPSFTDSPISASEPAANNPMFMIKDFNSTGMLKTDNTLMTNADTIFCAVKGLPISDINPFTKKRLEQNKSNGIIIHPDSDWNAEVQKHRTTFTYDPNDGYIIRENLFDPKNWTKLSHNK